MRINRLFLPLETKDGLDVSPERLMCDSEIELKLAMPGQGEEARADAHPDDRVISGYAAVFNNVDGGGDCILPGAFKKTLADFQKRKAMPPILWQHNPNMPIGLWDEMVEDEKGLKVTGTLFGDIPQAMIASVALKRKAIKGLSIGYRTVDSDINSKSYVRSIKELALFEASTVTFPMNTKAGVSQIKSEFQFPSDRELEKAYRDGGLSQREAVIAVALTKKMVSRDGETTEQPHREGAGELLMATRRAAALFS